MSVNVASALLDHIAKKSMHARLHLAQTMEFVWIYLKDTKGIRTSAYALMVRSFKQATHTDSKAH
jgi:hypothetical protein